MSTDLGPRTGGCHCGAVRFTAARVPAHVHACHCTICRRISGSATLSVNIPADAMAVQGAPAVYPSSDWAERAFCARCGSGLWWRMQGDPTADYIIALGALDDPSGLTLDREIYIDRKPAGYAFAGDHPRLTEAEFLATLPPPEGAQP
jgi:hypothetical protein